MRNIENETRRTMNSRRNFVNYATMTLSDGTVLELKPSDFRIAGQSFTDDWADGDSFQIGTAIGKTATLLLDNTDGREENIFELQTSEPADWNTNYTDYYTYSGGFYYPVREEDVPTWTTDTYYTLTDSKTYLHGKFSEYDFYMAYFTLDVCLPEAYHYGGELRDQMIRIGTFTVTTPTSHGATIEIVGVDNMYLFDKSFDECDLDFESGPTLLNILNKCCSDVGIILVTQSFDNQNIRIYTRPEDTTYRQVVSWIAQIAGCNAVITETGDLKLKSYDMSVLHGLDGGSFTAIGEEFLYMRKFSWESGAGTGWNTYYDRIPTTGMYKITRLVVSDIEDPSTFDGYFEATEHDYFRDSVNNGVAFNSSNRYNRRSLLKLPLVDGENIPEDDIVLNITASNQPNYWLGIGSESTNGSKFSIEIYMAQVSYADGDSADGGNFESECLRATVNWDKSSGGSLSDDIRWYATSYSSPMYIGPAGQYLMTRTTIDDIEDPSHLNILYRIQKSVDTGHTWTTEDSGTLVAGDNIINFPMELDDSNTMWYRISIGQNIVTDPNASSFRARHYFKANDSLYLNGDNFDGGDFTTSLGFHNLTYISGTSISTDDIQFTGVSVASEDSSSHYPNISDWDYYALEITENPFVVDNESTIAQSIYNKISVLKFRPFTTSSLQDPTIEAGDPCVVYDVKGNMYKSIITNVVFKTGGMTELSCNAEPPVKQGARYSAPASIRKVANSMTSYQSHTAHFNEIATAALGYFKTEEVDAQTGATITYLHDQPTLESSQNVVKIANGIVAISDNYNTSQRSWNTGFDASTGTMLLNLIYVHGLTSDWINTGELTVGGVDNIDGIIHVVNEQKYGDGSWNGAGHEGSDWWNIFNFRYTWLKPAGTYTITKVVVDNVEDPTLFDSLDYQYMIKVSKDEGSTWTIVATGKLVVGDNIVNYSMDIVETDEYRYQLWAGKYNVSATDPTFNYHPYTTRVNTTIDKDGVTVYRGNIRLGPYDSSTTHYAFEANDNGNVYATQGQIAGYNISTSEGFTYNTDAYFCQYSKYMMHIGGKWNSSYWTFFGVANKGEFIHLDYGGSSVGGLWITNNGKNDIWDFSGGAMHITKSSVSCDAHGEVEWSGSDRKLKKNIKKLTLKKAKELIFSVIPREFEMKARKGKRYGFIAQELREVLSDDSGIEFESNGIKNINYNDFIAPLCMIIKDQQKQIDALKKRLDKLEGK